jgi:DNA-binding NarL/FixJ family response regulator/GAF domain-containing protein
VLLRRSSAFEPAELARFAPIGALLIELHEETRSRLRARTALEHMDERLRLHDEVRPALADAHDAAALLEEATRAIAERFQADSTSVMLIDTDGQLHVRGAFGLAPEVVQSAQRRIGEGIAGWVAERGEPVILRGPIDDWRFRGVDPEARAALSVPLRLRGETIGVLNVKRRRATDLFDETHLRILESIAGDLAASLRHVQTIERLEDDRRQAVSLAEIARLAQSGDRRTAAALACDAFGFVAIAIATPAGMEVLHSLRDGALEDAGVVRVSTPTGTVLLATEGAGPEDAIREWVANLLAPPTSPEDSSPRSVPTRRIRVFLTDPHAIVREGLRTILEHDGDITIIGSASTLGEAVALLAEAKPDVVVANLETLGDERAFARLQAATRALTVVVAREGSTPGVIAALKAGAHGFLPRHAAPGEIRAAIRAASEGLVALHRTAAMAVGQLGTGPESAGAPPVPPAGAGEPVTRAGEPSEALTPRELEYLRYIADGQTNKEIARTMVLAEDTVKKGVQGLIAKLGAADRTHAVAIALRAGLIR